MNATFQKIHKLIKVARSSKQLNMIEESFKNRKKIKLQNGNESQLTKHNSFIEKTEKGLQTKKYHLPKKA